MPDILEPPKSRWHRRYFHSRVLLMILLVIILIIGFLMPNGALKAGLLIVLISYLIHLIMDSKTPAGLPLWDR